MAEPTPCSKVGQMMLCDVFAKELVQGVNLRRSLRENVFQELSRQGGGAALRNSASDLGKVFIDAAERGRSRPPIPASLQMASAPDVPEPMHSLQPIKRVPTPYRWSSTPSLSSVTSSRLDDKKRDPFHSNPEKNLQHHARWPAPNVGRKLKLPVDRSSDMTMTVPSILVASDSVPTLPLQQMQNNSRLAKTLAKMKKTKGDPGAHLRVCPIQMGVPAQLTSTYMAQSTEPIQKAADPKWSTDLKKLDVTVGKKLKYETRLSAGGSSLCPELCYHPKDF